MAMHGELLKRLDEDRDLVGGATRGGLARVAASRAYLKRSREALAVGTGATLEAGRRAWPVPLEG